MVDLARENPAFAARMQNLINAAQAATGSTVTPTSGFRSPEEQAQIYANTYYRDPARPYVYNGVSYPVTGPSSRIAAKPGGSEHQSGTAMDVQPSGAAWSWMTKNASRFGIEWGGNWSGSQNDPPHFQLTRSDMALALAGKLPMPPGTDIPNVAPTQSAYAGPPPRVDPRSAALSAIGASTAPRSFTIPALPTTSLNAGDSLAFPDAPRTPRPATAQPAPSLNAGDSLAFDPIPSTAGNGSPMPLFHIDPATGHVVMDAPPAPNSSGSPDERGAQGAPPSTFPGRPVTPSPNNTGAATPSAMPFSPGYNAVTDAQRTAMAALPPQPVMPPLPRPDPRGQTASPSTLGPAATPPMSVSDMYKGIYPPSATGTPPSIFSVSDLYKGIYPPNAPVSPPGTPPSTFPARPVAPSPNNSGAPPVAGIPDPYKPNSGPFSYATPHPPAVAPPAPAANSSGSPDDRGTPFNYGSGATRTADGIAGTVQMTPGARPASVPPPTPWTFAPPPAPAANSSGSPDDRSTQPSSAPPLPRPRPVSITSPIDALYGDNPPASTSSGSIPDPAPRPNTPFTYDLPPPPTVDNPGTVLGGASRRIDPSVLQPFANGLSELAGWLAPPASGAPAPAPAPRPSLPFSYAAPPSSRSSSSSSSPPYSSGFSIPAPAPRPDLPFSYAAPPSSRTIQVANPAYQTWLESPGDAAQAAARTANPMGGPNGLSAADFAPPPPARGPAPPKFIARTVPVAAPAYRPQAAIVPPAPRPPPSAAMQAAMDGHPDTAVSGGAGLSDPGMTPAMVAAYTALTSPADRAAFDAQRLAVMKGAYNPNATFTFVNAAGQSIAA